MKFSTSLVASVLVVGVSCLPFRHGILKRDVNPSLIPNLGFTAGVNPDGHGNCDGAVNDKNGKPILVPCACPPNNASFAKALNENVNAGIAVHNPSVKVTFPTGPSVQDQLGRIEAAIVTLQNLNGPGKGCPVVSTTLGIQQKALQDGGSQVQASPAPKSTSKTSSAASTPTPAKAPAKAAAPAPAPVKAAPTPVASPAANTPLSSLSFEQLDALVPQFGHDSGVNPTGTGDCDGAVNGKDGKPIKVPCSCPPPRQKFLASVKADIVAGHAVHNTGVKVNFPLDNSKNSQRSRVQTSIVSLQNLFGPGKGCPASSTTFSAQLAAL